MGVGQRKMLGRTGHEVLLAGGRKEINIKVGSMGNSRRKGETHCRN